MCLSTVYRGEKAEENMLCQYVASIEVDGDTIVFTDVMGTTTTVTGRLVRADLTAGTVILAAE